MGLGRLVDEWQRRQAEARGDDVVGVGEPGRGPHELARQGGEPRAVGRVEARQERVLGRAGQRREERVVRGAERDEGTVDVEEEEGRATGKP